MKIACVFKNDSHFKAVYETGVRICEQYSCKADFIGIDTDFYSKSIFNIIYIKKDDLRILLKYDYIITCLGGYLLNIVVKYLVETNVKVISLFPGIVSHYQLDAFISRLNTDQVWLNSKADFYLYNKICQLFGISNNSILYGIPWVDLDLMEEMKFIPKENTAIFFEQTELFNTIKKQQRLVESLNNIIANNPNILFKYKIRNNTTSFFFLSLRENIKKFKNVVVVDSLDKREIASTSYFLSVSSSALIEGIVYGINSYIIDEKLLDIFAKDFYKDSDITLKGLKLKGSSDLCANWCDYRISLPTVTVNLKYIVKNQNILSVNKRGYIETWIILIRLIILYPNINISILRNKYAKAIQKAINYIS